MAALAALLSGAALAQLEPPFPGPGQGNRDQQAQAQSDTKSRSAEERGTKQIPFVVEVAPSEEAKKQADEDAKERKTKASSDWWLIVLTGVLAIATIALVVVTGGLVWFAWRQSSDMKASIAAAEDSAKAASAAVELTRTSLILVERPRIRVGNIWTGNSERERPQFFRHGTISGQFDFENIGGTSANILDADVFVYSGEHGLPFRYPVGTRRNPTGKRINKNPVICKRKLAPGEMDSAIFSGEGYHRFQGEQADAIGTGRPGFYLYVMGWVEFSDDLGIVRRTRFCREYNHVAGRFLPVNDPDYEYEA